MAINAGRTADIKQKNVGGIVGGVIVASLVALAVIGIVVVVVIYLWM